MPAAEPPDGTISIVSSPRGDTANQQILNVPNWASSGHRISLIFNDYPQDCAGRGPVACISPSPGPLRSSSCLSLTPDSRPYDELTGTRPQMASAPVP